MTDSYAEPSQKRRRLSNGDSGHINDRSSHRTLAKSISPPPHRTRDVEGPRFMRSPFQLTSIHDLPPASNVDTVSLKDILGDPLIAECWEFNYLHDLDFLMEAFDVDVRDMVKIHVIHGFWKQEDQSRQNLQLQASKYPNITLHTAFMPEMFGTHHSKMLILIRHDSTAQVIIHTANMIPFDWTNMTQGLWRSPLLPKIVDDRCQSLRPPSVGSGLKFKNDLINYLRAYDTKRTICKPLIQELSKYDFSEVRAALVASVPGKQGIETDAETMWGWPALKNILSTVPVQNGEAEIVVQISSIATLGQKDTWLDKILFKAMGNSKTTASSQTKFRIIFPTADEIRRSLNGYRSGSAVHMKIQTAAQDKQLQYLRPMLCHWAGDSARRSPNALVPISDAGRKRAAPHIKTYIRFANTERSSIDWMLVTSANLSKQAWGEATNPAGDVRICSYEIGVMVWPGLFGDKAIMVPTFKSDTPSASGRVDFGVIIGARVPYDLPLSPYKKDDMPWCATSAYTEPDWSGQTWNTQD